MTVKKLRAAVLLCCAAAAVALGVAPSLLQFFAEQSLIKLRARGVRLNIDGIQGFILGVGAERLESWVPVGAPNQGAVPIQIIIDKPEAKLKVPWFTMSLPVLDLSGLLYGGQLRARLTDILSLRGLSFDATDIDLSLHPQLRALGIEEGQISVSTDNHPLDLKWAGKSSYTVLVDQVRFAPPAMLRSFIALNQISDGALEAEISVNPGGQVSLSAAKFDSSLASGELTGLAAISPSGHLRIKTGSIKVFLNRPDSPKLGNWLPLITNQKVLPDATSFACSFQATSCTDRYDIKIGHDCLRSKCE
jgi:hypothetical protein